MSASLQMSFQMTKGSDEEFQAVLKTLRRMGGSETETWWGLNEAGHSFTIGNGDFSRVWGEDFLEIDNTPYVLFAEAALNAEWTASSERCDESTGDSSQDEARYAEGKIRYKSIKHGSYADGEWDADEELNGEEEWIECTIIIKKYFEERESLEGKTFVIAGKLNYSYSRGALADCISFHGGQVAENITEDTDYCVCNDSDAAAAKQASKLGVPVISEEDFVKRFGDPYDGDVAYE